MRPSKEATPLAVMRSQINKAKFRLGQKEVADWLDVAAGHYRKIECGLESLTPRHAEAISRQTRVSPASLLTGNPNLPLKNVYGNPWTVKDFEECQRQGPRWKRIVTQLTFAKTVALTADILLFARQDGEARFHDCVQKINAALQQIYCKLDKTGIHKSGILGTTFNGHPTETRADLDPILDALEAKFKTLRAQGKF